MTALALRTLTESNSSKNKDYVAVLLQTEVVLREGARPESPGIIVKSISQKEKEAKTQDRNARAERRANEDEDLGRGWKSSPLGQGKHAWGAGDEEDFETPVRPVKRVRADGEGFDDEDEKKRVKWDRGLYQEIYLDEIQPRTTHTRITQESIKKGCLAPTAKVDEQSKNST
ncbi:hypothetical protein F5878DRAFT_667618 [Lentinula raphanica]|uniref:Uncharacterized protein n=1 Tax=Lentinula raphanica TaxID=153919 RepID=A0AA38NVH7_9AGAR|nr:hypothetical protein F5878DRAFT_667618 [Lentinula raphanica]